MLLLLFIVVGYLIFTANTSDADIGTNAIHTFYTNHTEGKFGVRHSFISFHTNIISQIICTVELGYNVPPREWNKYVLTEFSVRTNRV